MNLPDRGSIPLGHPLVCFSTGRGPVVTAVLNRPTLVLNRNWQPVGVATVAKSLVKVWNETARIVDPDDYCQYSWSDWAQLSPADDELVIRTRANRLRVPEVIVLTSYDRLPPNAVTFSRRNIFKRDRFTCQYCGKQPGSEELTIDHVLPRAQGGTSTWENCVLACIECNAKKADRTPDRRGCHCAASQCGRSGSRCMARTECGSTAGSGSSARRTGQFSWKSESCCS